MPSDDWNDEPELTEANYATIGEQLAQAMRGERTPATVVFDMPTDGTADLDVAVQFLLWRDTNNKNGQKA